MSAAKRRTAKRVPLSVVMPVYNALPYLDEAIESILRQTFSDFEFVILDDSSTDGSSDRLRHWAGRDSRIRLIEEKRNLGPVLSSERVARAARSAIVARMDADDISHPDRLEKQIALFRHGPAIGVVGCLADVVDSSGSVVREPDLWRLTRKSWAVPFAHGAMMYRREIFEGVGGYRQECALWEDQDLVTRMAEVSTVVVIPQPLYSVRQTSTSTRYRSDLARQEEALDAMYRYCCPGSGAIAREKAAGGRARVDPRVFIALGSVILWAGGRPRLFSRLLERGRLSPDRRSLSALIWTAWASASPRSLRAVLRALQFLRNARAGRALAPGSPVAWAPPTESRRSAVQRGES